MRKNITTNNLIPDFIPSELESFARAQLKETGVELLDNDYVAWVITKAFRNNPRQVIQFTNILLANYLLVEQRQGTGKDFPDDFLKENIPQLTKYLVLNQLFPDEMDILRENKLLNLDDALGMTLSTETAREFHDFVEQTKNIPIPDLRTYFTLRRSEQEKKFPGFESFVELLEDRNVEEAVKYFDQLGDLSQPDLGADFSQAIKKELESKTNPVSTVNLIHTLLAVLAQKNIALTTTLYEEVNNILNGRCREELHTIPPNILNDAFLTKHANYRSGVVSQWIAVLEDISPGPNKYKSDRVFARAVFEILAAQPDYLNGAQNKKVRDLLAGNFSNDIDIAKTIVAATASQAKFATGGYVSNYLNTITNEGSPEDIAARTAILNGFQDGILKSTGADVLVNKFIAIQTAQNQNTKPETFSEKTKILDEFHKFIRDHKAVFSTATPNVQDAFADILNAGFNAQPDHQVRAIFVPILFVVREYVTATKKDELVRSVSSWAGSVSPDVFGSIFDSLSEEDRANFFSSTIYDTASNRALTDTSFREAFFARIPDTRKSEFLEKMLNSDFDRGFAYFESLPPKETKHLFGIFDKVWGKFASLNPAQKERLFKFVNDRKANNEAAIREVLADKISASLTTLDPALQQLGSQALEQASTHISKDLKRRIAKEAVDWIKNPEVTPKYQAHAIRAIVSQTEQLNQEEQNELIHFLFDEIVRKASNQSHLAGAFEALQILKPKYEDRKQNFDDARARIEKEENQDIKKILIEGLYSLKPGKTNKEINEDFWTWVQSQKDSISTSGI